MQRRPNAEEEAAIQHHCHNNMIHNQIERIRKKGIIAWPLILREFSDMPDAIYYLLLQSTAEAWRYDWPYVPWLQDFD